MKQYILDFSNSGSVADMHAVIAKTCGFPEHYGANLDALWDCLSGDLETPAEFIIIGKGVAEKISSSSVFFNLLDEYAEENPDELKLVYR